MAAEYEDIIKVRQHHEDTVERVIGTFQSMLERMTQIAGAVSAKVTNFSETEYVAYKVGDAMGARQSPVQKLQCCRRAIYQTAQIVSDFRVNKFQLAYQIQSDCKGMYSSVWTSIIGDEVTLAHLSTNADKEREASYILIEITRIKDKIQTLYTTTRNNVDWMVENLDQLNKIESALRLEHNMKLTLNDIGNNGSDEIPGHEAEGVDLSDLDHTEISKPATSTPHGSRAVMEQGHDPLDDLMEES